MYAVVIDRSNLPHVVFDTAVIPAFTWSISRIVISNCVALSRDITSGSLTDHIIATQRIGFAFFFLFFSLIIVDDEWASELAPKERTSIVEICMYAKDAAQVIS